jgi:type II secretory pathway component PulK
MIRPTSSRHYRNRCGAILIVAMVITFTLAGLVLVLCRSMRVESLAAANMAASIQASEVERGAEQYLLAMLTEEGENVRDLTEDQFSGIQVGDGYFWVLRPDYDDSQLPAFGFVEESAKVNLNSVSFDSLMKLPGMADDIAGAVVDWRDDDSDPSPSGAESDYYLSLAEPYYAKNSPLETVEEMLMIRGVTHDVLYGDGTAPPLGQKSSILGSSGGSFTTDPQLARGLFDLLTVYSREPNNSASGQPRVNLQDRNARQQLVNALADAGINATRAGEIVGTLGRDRPTDIFDFYFKVKLTPDELDKVADSLTTTSNRTLTGRININTAPRSVLLCLDGLESADVDKLIAQRPTDLSSNPNALSWVVQALGDKAVGLGGQITTRTYQYSADILAISGNGKSFKRCRVVFDTRSGSPLIIFRRDTTARGWPMDKQILAAFRAGQGAAAAGSTASGMTGLNSGL